MKLLFDENLALRLVTALADVFPESQHVAAVGLGSSTDEVVWTYARDHGYTIVSKDSDFHERSLLFGHPPKVVWIRRGNCGTGDIEQMLRKHAPDLEKLSAERLATCLILR